MGLEVGSITNNKGGFEMLKVLKRVLKDYYKGLMFWLLTIGTLPEQFINLMKG